MKDQVPHPYETAGVAMCILIFTFLDIGFTGMHWMRKNFRSIS